VNSKAQFLKKKW